MNVRASVCARMCSPTKQEPKDLRGQRNLVTRVPSLRERSLGQEETGATAAVKGLAGAGRGLVLAGREVAEAAASAADLPEAEGADSEVEARGVVEVALEGVLGEAAALAGAALAAGAARDLVEAVEEAGASEAPEETGWEAEAVGGTVAAEKEVAAVVGADSEVGD